MFERSVDLRGATGSLTLGNLKFGASDVSVQDVVGGVVRSS